MRTQIVGALRIYSLQMVIRHFVSLVTVLALAVLPSMLEVCQASCLLHAGQTAKKTCARHQHSSARSTDTAVPAGGVQRQRTEAPLLLPSPVMTAGQDYSCDHDVLSAVSAAPNASLLAAPAVLVTSVEFPEPSVRPLGVLDIGARRSLEPVVLTTQLRV